MGARTLPLYSTLEDEPEHHEFIDRFVVGLGQAVDRLQDLEADDALEALQVEGLALADEADKAGYPPLAQVARDVARAAAEGKRDSAHDGLVELTELARRARLGHRGAA